MNYCVIFYPRKTFSKYGKVSVTIDYMPQICKRFNVMLHNLYVIPTIMHGDTFAHFKFQTKIAIFFYFSMNSVTVFRIILKLVDKNSSRRQ